MNKWLLVAACLLFAGCLQVSSSETIIEPYESVEGYEQTWDVSGPTRIQFEVATECDVYWTSWIGGNGPYAVITSEWGGSYAWTSLHSKFNQGTSLLAVNINANTGGGPPAVQFSVNEGNKTVTLMYEGEGNLHQFSECPAQVDLVETQTLQSFVDHQEGIVLESSGVHQRTFAEPLTGERYTIAFEENDNQVFALNLGQDMFDSIEYDSRPQHGTLDTNILTGTWAGLEGAFWLATY